MNKFKSLLSIAAFAVLAACGGASPDAGPPPLEGARMGGAFSLMNQDGKTVTDKDFAGKYRLIYFGYSFCPDVCPVDAQVMGRALKMFEAVAQIDDVAQRYGIAFMRAKPNADGAYLVDHARMIVLYGPEGQPIAIMPQNAGETAAQDMAAELARWVK